MLPDPHNLGFSPNAGRPADAARNPEISPMKKALPPPPPPHRPRPRLANPGSPVKARKAAHAQAPAAVRRSNAEMSAETQARTLQAAIASLAELGYAGTTMSGIANRVGVSRAALLYHFSSKNSLMAAVINAIYDDLALRYQTAGHPALRAEERILAIIDASYQFTTTQNQMAQIELLLAAQRDPEFRQEVAPLIESRDRDFEAAWTRLTAGFKGKRARLDLVRDFAVSVFRGIAVNRSLASRPDSFERQLMLLRKLVLDAL